jgi:hypothetical protein
MSALEEIAEKYVTQHPDLITKEQARSMLDVIRAERGEMATVNDALFDDVDGVAQGSGSSRRLTKAEMEALLAKRIEQMKSGGTEDNATDQFRTFSYIISRLQGDGPPLRLMVQVRLCVKVAGYPLNDNTASLQASAGTGKSFLLTNVFLWCILHDMNTKACAPTGVALSSMQFLNW